MRRVPLDSSYEETLQLKIDSETFNVISAAQLYAQKSGAEQIDDTHLLLGALAVDCDEAGTLRELLALCGFKWDEVWLYAAATAGLEAEPPTTRHASSDAGAGQKATFQPTERAFAVILKAEVEAGNFAISPVHFFIACFSTPGDSQLTETFAPLSIEPMQVRLHLKQLVRVQNEIAQFSHHPLMMLAPDGERAIGAAHAAMRASFCGRISTLHLLLGILEDPENEAVVPLQNSGIDVEALRTKARLAIANDGAIAGPELKFTPAAKRAIERAKDALHKSERAQIGTLELWQGLQPHSVFWLEIFHFGWNPDDPAAKILRDVDAELTRATFEPRTAATSQAKKVSMTPAQTRKFSSGPFWMLFAIQICLGVSLQNVAWNLYQSRDLRAVILLLFVTSGLVTALSYIIPRAAPYKTPLTLAFGGAFFGMLVVFYLGR